MSVVCRPDDEGVVQYARTDLEHLGVQQHMCHIIYRGRLFP